MESIQEAAERLTAHIGKLAKVYEYRRPDGTLSFCNLRIVQGDGRKTFRMMSDAGCGFELKRDDSLKPPDGWPLYGLSTLERSGNVWVVEGEKDVDSLHALGLACVTSGSSSTERNADWAPLAGREVVLWPDNDDGGKRYAERVGEIIERSAAGVSTIDVDALALAQGADCSDWLALHLSAGGEVISRLARVKKPGAGAPYDLPTALIVRGDAIAIAPVDWLWSGWLAAGKFHLLGGQQSSGKTTIALTLAAIITTGGQWPDGTQAQRGSVVMWSGEDDPGDTLVPRLLAAGADISRVHLVTGMREERETYPFDPARDTESLRRALESIEDLRLIVVDPIVSAVAGDSHKNAEVRRGLQPLVDLAQTKRCALLGVTHFSKGTGGREPIERITGSLAFGALARVILVTAKRDAGENSPATRLLARAKSNIGPDGGGFVYDIEQSELPNHPGITASVVLWGDALEGTARALLADAERQVDDEAPDVVTFLRELLAGGPLSVSQVRLRAQESGLAWRSVQRAMKSADVKPGRAGFGQPGTWQLSSRATSISSAPSTPTNLCGAVGATDPVTSMKVEPRAPQEFEDRCGAVKSLGVKTETNEFGPYREYALTPPTIVGNPIKETPTRNIVHGLGPIDAYLFDPSSHIDSKFFVSVAAVVVEEPSPTEQMFETEV